MNRVSEVVKKLFPQDFEEAVPVRKKHWWQKIDTSKIKQQKLWTWVVCILVAFHLVLGSYYYNHFVQMETQVLTDMAQIQAQLQRRKDLIINLTKTVIDYADHERTMFRYMADTRASSLDTTQNIVEALKAEGIIDFAALQNSNLEGAVAKLLALAENYPELKLSSNFQKLMDTLVNIEDQIVERRMLYNASCNVYGTYTRQFPQNIFARVFSFQKYSFVEVDKDVELFNRVEY